MRPILNTLTDLQSYLSIELAFHFTFLSTEFIIFKYATRKANFKKKKEANIYMEVSAWDKFYHFSFLFEPFNGGIWTFWIGGQKRNPVGSSWYFHIEQSWPCFHFCIYWIFCFGVFQEEIISDEASLTILSFYTIDDFTPFDSGVTFKFFWAFYFMPGMIVKFEFAIYQREDSYVRYPSGRNIP